MKLVLLYLLLALPILSSAQSNFHKGYVITNSGDTVKGYVDYKERQLNPTSVIFKIGMNDKSKIYTSGDCMGYGVDGLEKYQREIVKVTMSKIEITRLSKGPDSSSKQDTAFLKVLQAGKNVTLFSYVDRVKTRFYIKDKDDSAPYELIRQMFFESEDSRKIITRNVYANQILLVMKKYNTGTEAQQDRLVYLHYTEGDLLRIVSLINDQRVVKSKYTRSRIFVGAGATSSKAGYTGTNELATGSQSKTSVMPMLTAGVDFFINPAIGKVIFRFELSYISNKSEVSKNVDDISYSYLQHVFNQRTISLTPQVIYNVYNTNPLKLFVGAGAGFGFSSYAKNLISYKDIYGRMQISPFNLPFSNLNVALPVTIGAVINKKIEISGGYYFPYALTRNGGAYDVTMQRYKIGINYLFGKH